MPDAAPATTATTMTADGKQPAPGTSSKRRTHTKSRLGCTSCRQRHVRCDLTRPRCTKCAKGGRDCSYQWLYRTVAPVESAHAGVQLRPRPAPSTEDETARGPGHESTVATPTTTTTTQTDTSSEPPRDRPRQYDLLHFELMDHFLTVLSRALELEHPLTTGLAGTIARQAHHCHYLMDELLALSAAHKAINLPTNDAHMRKALEDEALRLQHRAIQGYRETEMPQTSGSGTPSRPDDHVRNIRVFFFSSLLSQHTLLDTFSEPRASFDAVLDQFVQCVRLHSGMPAVVKDSRAVFEESIKSSLGIRSAPNGPHAASGIQGQNHNQNQIHMATFTHGPLPVHEGRPSRHGIECSRLADFLKTNSDGTDCSIKACHDALLSLKTMFDEEERCSDQGQKKMFLVRVVHEWPVRLSTVFVDLLEQRKPEALVVLAHYAVLLHLARFYWAVGDAGRYLCTNIPRHLTGVFHQWLGWPCTFVLGTQEPSPASG